MQEAGYQSLFDQFIRENLPAGTFVEAFMKEWRKDRDEATRHDPRFQRLLDRIFTACDCYEPQPALPIEIDAEQLRREVELLHHIWFGEGREEQDLSL